MKCATCSTDMDRSHCELCTICHDCVSGEILLSRLKSPRRHWHLFNLASQQTDWLARYSDSYDLLPDRLVGIELEVARISKTFNVAIAKVVQGWGKGSHVTSDISIPNEGFEIVLSPRAGDEVITALDSLAEALKAEKALTNHRSCGLHVHVEAPDYQGVFGTLLLWRHVEAEVLARMPARRRNNPFCQPMAKLPLRLGDWPDDETGWMKRVSEFVYSDPLIHREHEFDVDVKTFDSGRFVADFDRWRLYAAQRKRCGSRFNAVNFHTAFTSPRTIEFRCAPSTRSAMHLRGWVQFCAWLVEFASKRTVKEVVQYVGDTSAHNAYLQFATYGEKDWMTQKW